MKRSASFLSLATFCLVTALNSIPSHAEVIFSDNFESGKLLSSYWKSPANVTASTDRAATGAYSAKFSFLSDGKYAWSELRFDLGRLYPELWIKYRVYIPTNYAHQNSSPTNNKLFRLWNNIYDDVEKVGASTWYSSGGYSSLRCDWNTGSGIGPKGSSYGNFISASDLGKWMEIKIYAKSATATQKGTIQIWKNGTLIINNSGTVDNYRSGEGHAFRYGYLFGWANAGFAEDTHFYMDDVIFATQESDLGGTVNTPIISPPTSLRISS